MRAGRTADARAPAPMADVRHARLRADVAARLSRVCADMPRWRFDALVDAICERTIRWEQRGGDRSTVC